MNVLLLTPPATRLMNPATAQEDLLPPKTWVPLGIAYLASALRQHDVETNLFDLHGYSWEEVSQLLKDVRPDVVGISCFTFGRSNALRLALLAKSALPAVTVIMGGPHATFFPEQMLESGFVDVVALGEGEVTIVELVRCLEQRRNWDSVKGIVFNKNGTVFRTEPRPRVSSLDDFAFPAYDTFDLSEYKSPEIPPYYKDAAGTHILTSRGCPFHCNFCSVNTFFNGKWAYRSPGNVVDEIEMLMESHNIRHIYFSDDLFTLDNSRAIALCKEILDRKLEFAWMAETRVDCVNDELLKWMRRAGCYRMYYGVESGSPRILKSANKGFTVEHIRNAFRLTHEAGMEPCCFLMVGNPGETPETIMETSELIHEIRPATMPVMGINTILPASAQYESAKAQGLIQDDYWLKADPPPLYTAEYGVDDLIYLQILLTKNIAPELYENMCQMGFDEKYFRMRRMAGRLAPRP